MLGQRMQHMIKEPNTSVQVDRLRLGRLCGMALGAIDLESRVGLGGECAAIKVDGHLDLGLVGVARNRRPAGCGCCGSHCNVYYMKKFLLIFDWHTFNAPRLATSLRCST